MSLASSFAKPAFCAPLMYSTWALILPNCLPMRSICSVSASSLRITADSSSRRALLGWGARVGDEGGGRGWGARVGARVRVGVEGEGAGVGAAGGGG